MQPINSAAFFDHVRAIHFRRVLPARATPPTRAPAIFPRIYKG